MTRMLGFFSCAIAGDADAQTGALDLSPLIVLIVLSVLWRFV